MRPHSVSFILLLLWRVATQTFAQNKIASIAADENKQGHFNGAILAIKDGRVVAHVNKGYANFQFKVPITHRTRFPIASMTKLFTAVLTLQLVEQAQLSLNARVSTYLPDLPAACQRITVYELLTHTSGLNNEPIKAYQSAYSTTEFVRNFVQKDSTKKVPAFNYNNVDYVVLTRLLERVTQQSFAHLLQANILAPLQMYDSGVVTESGIIPYLAYGYHNYSFGNGSSMDTLRNDRRFLSNYAGAGAIYCTADDLHKFVLGLKAHTLLSAKTIQTYLLKPQQSDFLDYARGYPTIGLFYNDRTLATPLFERRGSIDGFNSVLLTNDQFTRVVIILTNTDQADLERLGDQVYNAF